MSDYIVTVCDRCLTASCWHGEFMCSDSQHAGTKELRASQLQKLGLEHPSNFSERKIIAVCGSVRFVEA